MPQSYKFFLSIFIAIALLSCSMFSSKDKKEESKPAGENIKTENSKTEAPKDAPVKTNGEVINYMGKSISFGSSPKDFLEGNPDYALCNDDNSDEYKEIKIYCKKNESTDAHGNMTWYRTYFSFYNNELFQMSISERWTDEKSAKNIDKLVKEFNVVKEKNSEEEGWSKQELKKGGLKGNYGADGDGTYFNCYDEAGLKKVKLRYSNYEVD